MPFSSVPNSFLIQKVALIAISEQNHSAVGSTDHTATPSSTCIRLFTTTITMTSRTLHHQLLDPLQHIAGQRIQRAQVSRSLLLFSRTPGLSQPPSHGSPGWRDVKASQQNFSRRVRSKPHEAGGGLQLLQQAQPASTRNVAALCILKVGQGGCSDPRGVGQPLGLQAPEYGHQPAPEDDTRQELHDSLQYLPAAQHTP
jgi:hypothetical protein